MKITPAMVESCCKAANEAAENEDEYCTEYMMRAALRKLEQDSAASHPEWSEHDRIEFALRDAGFSMDRAAQIAEMATEQDSAATEPGMCPNCVTPWKCNGPHEDSAATGAQGNSAHVGVVIYEGDDPVVYWRFHFECDGNELRKVWHTPPPGTRIYCWPLQPVPDDCARVKAPAPRGVTDAMVNRALAAWCAAPVARDCGKSQMRAAIEAALAAEQKEGKC